MARTCLRYILNCEKLVEITQRISHQALCFSNSHACISDDARNGRPSVVINDTLIVNRFLEQGRRICHAKIMIMKQKFQLSSYKHILNQQRQLLNVSQYFHFMFANCFNIFQLTCIHVVCFYFHKMFNFIKIFLWNNTCLCSSMNIVEHIL